MQTQTTPPFVTPEPKGGNMIPTPRTRELAARDNDGIHVALLWHARDDTVTVSVDDSRAGSHFELAVARDRALQAFYHPFAYAA